MMRASFLIKILLLLMVASCATNLDDLAMREDKLRQEEFYSSYLSLEYLQLSRALLQNGNYIDSEHFAKKGMLASVGLDPAPESPHKWNVGPDQFEDLVVARKRYEMIATIEMKNILPIQMAHLTFLYDCWVAKEAKPAFRLGEMKKCKDRFYKLVEEMEYFVQNLGKKPEIAEIIERSVDRYLIIFDFDKYKINSAARKRLIKVLEKVDKMDGNYNVVLVGNADSKGASLYNERLSLKRAKIVEGILRRNGVPKELIEVRVQGEDYPDLVTLDDTRQRFNRTVEIYIVQGVTEVKDVPIPILFNEAYRKEILAEKKKRGWE